MPIVDGLTSTRMIRGVEKAPEHGGHSEIAASNGRIPIFAVSASLLERDRQVYIDGGFDGWILKPVDFKRLNTLLTGIRDDEIRASCLYAPGQWERGGWFCTKAEIEGTPTEDEVTPKAEDEQGEMKEYVDPSAAPFEDSPAADTPTDNTPQATES